MNNCRTPTYSSPQTLHRKSETFSNESHGGWTTIIYAGGSRWWEPPVKSPSQIQFGVLRGLSGLTAVVPNVRFFGERILLHDIYSIAAALRSAVRSVIDPGLMVCIFATVRLAAWDAFSTLGCVGTRLTVFGRHDCSSIDVWPTGETLSSRTRIIESDTASAVMSYRFLPVHSQALDQVLPGGPTGPAFHGRMVVAPNTYSPTCAVHAAIIVDFVGRTSHSLPCEIKARDDQHCRSTYSRVVRKSGGDLTGPHACRKDGISRQRLETSDI